MWLKGKFHSHGKPKYKYRGGEYSKAETFGEEV